MSRKPRTRKSPEQLEQERIQQRARDLEAVNVQPEAANLPRQADIETTRAGDQRDKAKDGKKADHDTARRLDAFEALKPGMAAGAYDAARRFEGDLLGRLGITDGARSLERIDCDPDLARAVRCAAFGQRVDAVQDRLAPRDFWLLIELIAPPIDRGTWRDHVSYITGETHTHAQGAIVRAVCVNLRDAYMAIERRAAA
jgi:hypothetical protein